MTKLALKLYFILKFAFTGVGWGWLMRQTKLKKYVVILLNSNKRSHPSNYVVFKLASPLF